MSNLELHLSEEKNTCQSKSQPETQHKKFSIISLLVLLFLSVACGVIFYLFTTIGFISA